MFQQKPNNWLVAFILLAASFACYYEVIPLNFFSDDFYVIHRLTIQKQFWAPGFFRPLSDVAFLFNYYLNHYDAWGYHLFNILVHTVNSFLVYLFVVAFFKETSITPYRIGILASLLFVCYPFLNETVVWLVGRASLIGNFFGLLSLWIVFSKRLSVAGIFCSCLCYFVGLTSYESIIILPGIIFIGLWYKKDLRSATRLMIPFVISLVAYLVVRWYIAGVVAGAYGRDMYGEGQTNYLLKFFKSFGRLFVPGIYDNRILIVSYCIVFILLVIVSYLLYKKRIPLVPVIPCSFQYAVNGSYSTGDVCGKYTYR